MTDILKEPGPSEAAWLSAGRTWMDTSSWTECVQAVFAIDIAPLIARNSELEAESKRLSLAVGASENEIGRLRSEVERLTKERDDAIEAAKRVSCSTFRLTRQNAALVEALRKNEQDASPSFMEAQDADELCRRIYEIRTRARTAIAQLDAPQPSEAELIEECTESHKEMNNLGWEIERMKAALAEAIEIMRRFLIAQQTNERGEYCGWRISGNGSVNQAAESARAFVEKRENGRAPQQAEMTVTDEEISLVRERLDNREPHEPLRKAIRAALEAFVKNRSGKR